MRVNVVTFLNDLDDLVYKDRAREHPFPYRSPGRHHRVVQRPPSGSDFDQKGTDGRNACVFTLCLGSRPSDRDRLATLFARLCSSPLTQHHPRLSSPHSTLSHLTLFLSLPIRSSLIGQT